LIQLIPVICEVYLEWSIAKILGKTAAKTEISNFTFSLKAKKSPYAKNVGAI
jgi:hypothetical protein